MRKWGWMIQMVIGLNEETLVPQFVENVHSPLNRKEMIRIYGMVFLLKLRFENLREIYSPITSAELSSPTFWRNRFKFLALLKDKLLMILTTATKKLNNSHLLKTGLFVLGSVCAFTGMCTYVDSQTQKCVGKQPSIVVVETAKSWWEEN